MAFLCLAACASGAFAAPESSDEAARLLATQLAEQAAAAEASGQRSEARRLLLRAVRWDPSRTEDYEQAIDSLSKTNPSAALRHARIVLPRAPGFGLENPQLLARLVTVASESESWAIAAELARRHREAVFAQSGVSRRRRAELELSASRLEFLADEVELASAGFHRLRRLQYGLPAGETPDEGPVPWLFAARCHLAAGESERAEEAVALMVRQSGETPEVELLRARLALARKEPLAAIQLAMRAVETASGDDQAAGGYEVLVKAFDAANQTVQARDWLRQVVEDRPNAVEPSLALADVLRRLGQRREAWNESQRLVGRLLDSTDPVDPLFGSTSPTGDDSGKRLDLAVASEHWIDASAEQGEVDAVFAALPRLAARLGGLEPIAAAVDRGVGRPTFRAAAEKWIASADPKGLTGSRRAGAFLACRLGEAATYQALVRSRIEEARKKGASHQRLVNEIALAAESLVEVSDDRRAEQFLRAAIKQFDESVGDKGDALATEIASLHQQLAEMITRRLPGDRAERREAVEQAVEALQRARELAPTDLDTSQSELFVFLRCGLVDRAIEAGERAWPNGQAIEVEPVGRREVGLLLDEALASRSESGDRARRVELLESLLDEWPEHPEALLRLAALFLDRQAHLARAERMARRAVELEPQSPTALATLGRVRRQQGRTAAAATLLGQAVEHLDAAGSEIDTDAADAIRADYADVLAALGQAEQAAAEAVP